MHRRALLILVAILAACSADPVAPGNPSVVNAEAALDQLQPEATLPQWTPVSIPTRNRVNSILAFSTTEYFLTADWGTFLHSVDGGATWSVVPSATSNPIYGVWGSSPSDLYVTSWYGTVQHWDGANWTDVGPGLYHPNSAIYRIWGSGPADIYTVGDEGMVWHFDGNAWARLDVGATHVRAFQGVWGTGANDVFIAGGSGGLSGYAPASILHYNGRRWTSMPLPSSVADLILGNVWGTGPRDVYAAGWDYSSTRGVILHYDGNRWTVNLAQDFTLLGVGGSAEQDKTVVGIGGRIGHYDGHAWRPVASPTSVDYSTVYFAPDGTGWIGGFYGTLLRRAPCPPRGRCTR